MSIPLIRLPSLDLIRGFVAVGRRMSITLAAQDLCVTQSAVSRQIHALEEQLGEISTAGVPRPVTVSASIGFTGLWLLPRLARFQQRHPGVDVRVSANNGLVDLRRDGIDLAIRYTAPSLAPAGAIRLFGESVAPVAHPSLGLTALRSERVIAEHALLEFDDTRHQWLQWRDWLAAHGLQQAKPQGVLHFNQYDQVIQAALAGHGIALGRLELIQPLLETQQLIQLAPALQSGDTAYAYWLIHADDHARDEVHQVAAWIEAETQAGGA